MKKLLKKIYGASKSENEYPFKALNYQHGEVNNYVLCTGMGRSGTHF